MALSFFRGKRSSKKPPQSDGDYRLHPDHSGQQNPRDSSNRIDKHSNTSCNIPVAVPIAYIPPPSPPPPQSNNRNPNNNVVDVDVDGGGGLLIANEELDRNLRLWQKSTFGGRTLLHKCFILLSIVTGLTAMNNIIAHFLAILLYGRYEDPMEVLLRWFTIGLYCFVILIECNHTPIVQQSLILQNWASKGLFYIFLATVGVVEYDVGQQNYGASYRNRYNQYTYGRNNRFVIYIPSGEDAGELYIWSVSWIMMVMGVIYVILGILCLHKKYQQLQQEYEQRSRQSQNNTIMPSHQQAYT